MKFFVIYVAGSRVASFSSWRHARRVQSALRLRGIRSRLRSERFRVESLLRSHVA